MAWGRRALATRPPRPRPPRQSAGARWEAPGWRRARQLALAALWLLDAVLRYQTFMFSQGFPRMLAATAAGNPAAWPPGDLERAPEGTPRGGERLVGVLAAARRAGSVARPRAGLATADAPT